MGDEVQSVKTYTMPGNRNMNVASFSTATLNDLGDGKVDQLEWDNGRGAKMARSSSSFWLASAVLFYLGGRKRDAVIALA
jgi:hypothetical protein